jgi:hemerythrin superfamily protein
MDIVTLLINDHRTVSKLLAKGEETTERAIKSRTQILSQIKEELKAHEKVEETLLYPLLKEYDTTRPLSFESYEEHRIVDDMIAKLETDDPGSETWAAKFILLRELINHHVKEEEGSLFPKTKKLIDKDKLQTMGEEMLRMKQA